MDAGVGGATTVKNQQHDFVLFIFVSSVI